MTPEVCLVCGGAQSTTVLSYTSPDVYEAAVGVTNDDYQRSWVRCSDCNFYYSRFSRHPDQLDSIYDIDYRDTSQSYRSETPEALFKRIVALPEDQSESFQRARDIQNTVNELKAAGVLKGWQASPHRLLDIGGASGVFAYLFQNDDWMAEIVDPGQQGKFIEAYGVTYHAQRFDGAFPKTGFDIVSMNYILEHVSDPCAVLALARDHLAPSGLLYVEVPDELAFGRVAEDDDIFNSCHLWMFGPKSLASLLDSAGFELLNLKRTKSPRGHYALSVLATPMTDGSWT